MDFNNSDLLVIIYAIVWSVAVMFAGYSLARTRRESGRGNRFLANFLAVLLITSLMLQVIFGGTEFGENSFLRSHWDQESCQQSVSLGLPQEELPSEARVAELSKKIRVLGCKKVIPFQEIVYTLDYVLSAEGMPKLIPYLKIVFEPASQGNPSNDDGGDICGYYLSSITAIVVYLACVTNEDGTTIDILTLFEILVHELDHAVWHLEGLPWNGFNLSHDDRPHEIRANLRKAWFTGSLLYRREGEPRPNPVQTTLGSFLRK